MIYLFDLVASDVFQNTEIVAAAIGALAFVFTFSVLSRSLNFQKGISLVIGLVVGFTAGWYLYQNEFTLEFTLAGVAVGLAALGMLLLIMRAFFRFGKHALHHG